MPALAAAEPDTVMPDVLVRLLGFCDSDASSATRPNWPELSEFSHKDTDTQTHTKMKVKIRI